MIKKFLNLILILIFFTPLWADEPKRCSWEGLGNEDFDNMEAILKKYVINSVDSLLNITHWKYDPNIPLSVYVRFREGAGIVDLVFGMEISNQRGFVFSSTRLPYEFSIIGLGFREKENQCNVYIIEAGPSGIVRLYLRNDVHTGFGSLNLTENNNPTFYSFPLVKSE